VVVMAHGFWNSFSLPSRPTPFSSYTEAQHTAGNRQKQLGGGRHTAAQIFLVSDRGMCGGGVWGGVVFGCRCSWQKGWFGALFYMVQATGDAAATSATAC
jgi:hypothetical protein